MRLGRLRRMGRRGVVALVVVLLAVVGAGAWLLTRPSGAAAAQTVTVDGGCRDLPADRRRDRHARADAGGRSRLRGERPGHEGATSRPVTRSIKGDRLATLDTSSLDAALTSAQAQLDAAEAQYDDDVDADASSTQLASDSAAVAAAKSALSQAQDDLDSATLRATHDRHRRLGRPDRRRAGERVVVLLVVAELGRRVRRIRRLGRELRAPPARSWSSRRVSFKVVADVTADDITSVKKGMQAQVTPSGATSPGLRHRHRRRPGRRGQLVGGGDVPGHRHGHRRAGQAVRRDVGHRLDHHQAGEQRARRTQPGAAHLRLHDVRREAGRRQAGAYDGQGRRDLRQQHRDHLRTEGRRQGRAGDPEAAHRQRQQRQRQQPLPRRRRGQLPGRRRRTSERQLPGSRRQHGARSSP